MDRVKCSLIDIFFRYRFEGKQPRKNTTKGMVVHRIYHP